jgi:uncharacterized protein
MNERIAEFLQQQTCSALCCVGSDGLPWCFSCYYAFDPENGLLYFKSSAQTKHAQIMLGNPLVAGTILPDKLNKLQSRGIQYQGIILPPGHPLTQHASSFYYKKHPVARAIPGDIYTLQLNTVKFTDNSLGFGKKFTWSREQTVIDE